MFFSSDAVYYTNHGRSETRVFGITPVKLYEAAGGCYSREGPHDNRDWVRRMLRFRLPLLIVSRIATMERLMVSQTAMKEDASDVTRASRGL